MQQVTLAVSAPFAGAHLLLTDPSALGLALLMGLLSGGILVGLLVAAVLAATPITDWLTSASGFWYVLVWIGVLIAELPLVLAAHRLLAGLVTGKLQASLSLAIDRRLDPSRPFPGSTSSLAASLGSAFFGLLKGIGLAAVILLVNFIPVAGQLAALVLAVGLSAKAQARDLLALPMEARGHDARAIDCELALHRPLWLGLGVVFTVLSMLPVLNMLAIPCGVAAVTRRYVDLERAPLPTETKRLTQ